MWILVSDKNYALISGEGHFKRLNYGVKALVTVDADVIDVVYIWIAT